MNGGYNEHPITGGNSPGSGGFNLGSVGSLITGNPLLAILAGLTLLAVILPPRKRKRKSYKPYNKRKKRRSSKRIKQRSVGRPVKSKKAKQKSKTGKSTSRGPGRPATSTKSRKTGTGSRRSKKSVPAWVKNKGFNSWSDYMSYLRSKRTKKAA